MVRIGIVGVGFMGMIHYLDVQKEIWTIVSFLLWKLASLCQL